MLRSGSSLPSLEGATSWINQAIAEEDLRGRPVLVQIWAVSCHICEENQPTLERWRARYRPRGVAFVSIHTPRQESDMNLEAVEEAVRRHRMDEPVAVDNDHAIMDAFDASGIWPAYFLFDAAGKLRSRAAGAAGLGVLESAIERLIAGAAA